MQRHVNAFFLTKRIEEGSERMVKLKKTERRVSRAKLHVLLVSYFCLVQHDNLASGYGLR